MHNEQIDAYIDAHKDEMLRDLCELVQINSQRGEAAPGKPFGQGPAEVLQKAEELMSSYGLTVTNYDNYVVTGDFGSKEDKVLDILAHLDVVPVTEDWTVTDPFTPKITDGRIYGRGTADDKGPAIAALYAVRAVKELGIPLKHSLRLIFGSDEECGSSDLEYYYGKEQEALYTFTPDADYPLINLEKGRLAKHVTKTYYDMESNLLDLSAGDKVNVVPARGYAIVQGIEREIIFAEAQKVQAETGIEMTVSEGNTLRIEAKGTAAHGSTPEQGNNVITALIMLLDRLPISEGAVSETIHTLASLFPHGDVTGMNLGIAMSDEKSGALSFNLGTIHLDGKELDLQFDIRCPLCANDKNVTRHLSCLFADHLLTMEEGEMTPPHYVPEDSVFVQTLLGSYEHYFGKPGKPLYTGGGTYVHELERGVAFGCMVSEVDNHMHGDDEFMEIEMLTKSAKIFADAIVKLCNI